MGRRIKSNFDRRFGSQIRIIYPNKPAGVSEQHIQSENIYKAFYEVMAGIIGREPTEIEIFGLENIGDKMLKEPRSRRIS